MAAIWLLWNFKIAVEYFGVFMMGLGLGFALCSLVTGKRRIHHTARSLQQFLDTNRELVERSMKTAEERYKDLVPNYHNYRYILGVDLEDDTFIQCNTCGKKSYNINDIENRYCGYCNKFHDDPKLEL